MTRRHNGDGDAGGRRIDDLTPSRVGRILLFSMAVWGGVAVYIRTAGPLGEFAPNHLIGTFVATALATIPLNWLTRKVAGLPAEKMVSVIAVASVVPPTLEGVLMSQFPAAYGGDPIVIGQAAVWLLFAIGVAMLLATVTSLFANRRLEVGDAAPPIQAGDVTGKDVVVPDRGGELTHVQFLRFAGCPVCNLHLQGFIKRCAELEGAGVREVVLFHSAKRFIDDYHGAMPFELIADPERKIYRRYRIEASPFAILSPFAWPGLIEGYRLKTAGRFDSTAFGQPADFLIDGAGRIVARHYGAHANDQWSVDEVLALATAEQRTGAAASMRILGAAA